MVFDLKCRHTSFQIASAVIDPCSLRRVKKSVSALAAAARFSMYSKGHKKLARRRGKALTFAQLFQIFPESFLPLSIVPTPAIKASILLPSSPEVGPG
jgi:hypothetical protein